LRGIEDGKRTATRDYLAGTRRRLTTGSLRIELDAPGRVAI